jgi:uncharacterized protein YuzE
MIISYDSCTDVVYIKFKSDMHVTKTVEFASETFIDLDKNNNLIGIELLNPAKSILIKLAKKFNLPELTKINPHKLHAAIH